MDFSAIFVGFRTWHKVSDEFPNSRCSASGKQHDDRCHAKLPELFPNLWRNESSVNIFSCCMAHRYAYGNEKY